MTAVNTVPVRTREGRIVRLVHFRDNHIVSFLYVDSKVQHLPGTNNNVTPSLCSPEVATSLETGCPRQLDVSATTEALQFLFSET